MARGFGGEKQPEDCGHGSKVDPDYIQPPLIEGYIEEQAGPGELVEERFEAVDGETVTRRRKRITLVMLSGGVDSVYALAKVLRESDDIVLAHHIHLVNQEGRHLAEAKACKDIVAYCKKHYRDFTYTESIVDRRRFKAFGMDIITAAFEAGIVVQSFHADTGSLVDRWTCGINAEDFDGWQAEDTRRHRRPSMLKAIEANCHPHKTPRFFNLPLRRKSELIQYLGPELASLCWTCRRPLKQADGAFAECGECQTCKIMSSISNH
jgi:7-cyano-7-deazaguanine synthase in queuosine biosynthesis